MVKVSDMIGTEPQGVWDHNIHPEDSQRMANQMRELLNADLWEEDKILAIYSFHGSLSQDWYHAVWPFLNSHERAAWKVYLDMAKRKTEWKPSLLERM